MTYRNAAASTVEYTLAVPYGEHDVNALLTRLARGHLSTTDDDYDDLKERVADEMYAYVGISR